MSIPTNKTREFEAFESKLEKMQKGDDIKFGCVKMNGCSQIGEERREVD